MSKFSDSDNEIIAHKFIMRALVDKDTNLEVGFNRFGQVTLNLGSSSRPVHVISPDIKFVDGTNTTEEEAERLRALGFINPLSASAGRIPVWLLLSERFKSFDYDYILTTLARDLKNGYRGYQYGQYKADDTFEFAAYRNLMALENERASGSSPADAKGSLKKIVDALAKAYNDTAIGRVS